jgi:hypothetical protein
VQREIARAPAGERLEIPEDAVRERQAAGGVRHEDRGDGTLQPSIVASAQTNSRSAVLTMRCQHESSRGKTSGPRRDSRRCGRASRPIAEKSETPERCEPTARFQRPLDVARQLFQR